MIYDFALGETMFGRGKGVEWYLTAIWARLFIYAYGLLGKQLQK